MSFETFSPEGEAKAAVHGVCRELQRLLADVQLLLTRHILGAKEARRGTNNNKK